MAVNDLADRKNDTAGPLVLMLSNFDPTLGLKKCWTKTYISSRHLATRFSFCRVMKPGCATSWVESPTQVGGWAVIFHRKSDVYWEYVPRSSSPFILAIPTTIVIHPTNVRVDDPCEPCISAV
jgi:hypothetical protein